MPPQKLETRPDLQSFVDRYDTFLLGKRLIFVTNNSNTSRKDYVKKFAKLGITAAEEEIFSSAYATAVYLADVAKFGSSNKSAYVIGGNGIRAELEEAQIDLSTLNEVEPNPRCGRCGVWHRLRGVLTASWPMPTSTWCITPTVCFIATNDDRTLPGGKYMYPGSGSLLNSLVSSTQKTPMVMGKPNQPMLDCVMRKYHLDAARTCMIGDRLDTDSVLAPTAPQATYYTSSLGNLAQLA
ncbi:HAD-like protein [Linderina pennispora]|uniref:HAD-like protein n=1 Tax=Linderina pennispora TaxID=61395 RepID=A0A1Y1WG63_9FUNG|nr:HAD-like protein [Linderina pennispora]ORX72206.1 HAD-like protein [Linderina pennispora]